MSKGVAIMSCCSSKSNHHRPHVKSCNECHKEGKCCRNPRFCVSNCTEKQECIVCACAKNGAVVAPGVEMKLPSIEGATYFWTICSPPYVDCSLDCVQGQNCITRSPSLRGLEGPTFSDDGAYKEIKYVGYVVKHDEALLQKVFRVRVYDLSCQPCDYTITPRDCLIDGSCSEITIEYCGSNFGSFDPTASSIDFSVTDNWMLNGMGGLPDAFGMREVTRTDAEKPCQGGTTHNLITINANLLDFADGRNTLTFEESGVTFVFKLTIFLVKCPTE